MKSGIIFFIFSIIFSIKTVQSVDFAFYCKCYCPPNSTIVKVKDCSVCNKNLCIEQKLCVFQNSTTTTATSTNNNISQNKPRSVQDDQYSEIKSSLVTYTEYLYASLFGRVKRNFMIKDNETIMNKEKRKVVQEVDKELNNNNNNEENDIKEDDNENNKNNVKEEDNNNEEENKEDKSEEKETSNTNNTSSTDANKPEETESVIHIIESGTDDGYQKSEEENWMTECFKRGSIKDEAIILLFLGSTGILLVYASMKKCFANNYEDGMKYNYTTLNNSN